MHEDFTHSARKTMQLANREAQRLNHYHCGTEHILLSLIKGDIGVAASVLKEFNIDRNRVYLEIEKIVPCGLDLVTSSGLSMTPRAEKVIELAVRYGLGSEYVETEHLLLGLIDLCQTGKPKCRARTVLLNLGIDLQQLREAVLSRMAIVEMQRESMPKPNAPTTYREE